jgi:hypothetical protein
MGQTEFENFMDIDGDKVDSLMDDLVDLMLTKIKASDKGELLNRITENIEYIQNRFSHIANYFWSLPKKEQKDIFLTFLNDEIRSLNDYKPEFKEKINNIETWNLNDGMIFSYYLLYQDRITELYAQLKKANANQIDTVFRELVITIFNSKPVFLAYFKNRLDSELLLDKFAELRTMTKPRGRREG